jgi:predicted nuclease of predicted toxin-antitoxin system
MRYLIDECVAPDLAHELAKLGHDIIRVAAVAASTSDAELLPLAHADSRVIVTLDHDFSALVFKKRLKALGVIVISSECLRPKAKLRAAEMAERIHFLGDTVLHRLTVIDRVKIRQKRLP